MSSIPKPRRDAPDVQPDAVKRTGLPDLPPDSLPNAEDDPVAATARAPDGGVREHPIHDHEEGDLGPEDYEAMFDEAAETGFEPDVDDSGEEGGREEPDGSPIGRAAPMRRERGH